MDFAIRRATLEDASGIAHVHVATWKSTYTGIMPQDFLDALTEERRLAMWQRGLANPDRANFEYVAISPDGQVVGFVSAGPESTGSEQYPAELYAIYLLEEYHGRGQGKRLFQAAVEELINREYQRMLLWVLEENASRGFYEKLGGVQIDNKPYEVGGQVLQAIGYGWDDILSIFPA